MPRQFGYGDIKFYYGIHVNKQKSLGNIPCSYYTFVWRLRKGMNLHDAIYYPRVGNKYRRAYKPTAEDNQRRRQKLNDENVMILDFDEIEKIENTKLPPTNKIKMPKPKQNIWSRFISLFR